MPPTTQRQPRCPCDPRFSEAEAALEAGQFDLAAKRYQAILDAEPANTEAALALRQVRLLERLQDIDPKLVARAETAPDDVPAQLAAADYALSRSDVDGALGRLLGLVRRVSGADRDAVRERLIEYFDLLGPDDPVSHPRGAPSPTLCSKAEGSARAAGLRSRAEPAAQFEVWGMIALAGITPSRPAR